MRKWLAPLLTSALALAIAGAVLAQSPAAKPQWTVALNEEAESVDPASSVLFASDIYHVHMFDSLVGLEGDELKPVPLLAERWEIVNPTTWRFRLRKGVKFHDGAAFDAQDVKYSIDTYLDPKNRRASFAKGIARVEVKDAYTVDVITSEPLASALFNVVRMYILPKDAREKMGAQAFSQHPIGTGPYKLVEWKRDQQLVLEANPGYWRGAVNPKRLVFRPIKDSATRTAELRSGGVDIIAAPSVPQLELLDSGDTRVVPVKGGRVIIYLMNVKQPPFDNKKVREAVNLAVNREAIVNPLAFDDERLPDEGSAVHHLAHLSVFPGQDMLMNAPQRRFQIRHDLLAAYHQDHLAGRAGVGAELTRRGGRCLQDAGIFDAIHDASRYDALRPRIFKMDRQTQAREIRKMTAAPDFMLGSVQAITDDGALVVVSYSASQIGPYASGAGRVILVVGSQKIVPDLDAALRRIREVAFPWENAQVQARLGVDTILEKVLIMYGEWTAGRTTVVLVREPVGI
jgi:hypothetical protein